MSRAWHHARVLLPWSCLVLLPVGRLVEAPVAIMALGGLILALRRGLGWLREPAPLLLLVVFACMWVPIAASVPDAVRPDQSLRIALNHLRFPLAGLFLVAALGSREPWERFMRLCAWLLVFWLVDAAVQAVVGRDLFGQAPTPGRITGPFGPRTGKFGLFLAVLSPLLIEHARRAWPRPAVMLAVVSTFAVVFVGGTRSGWVAAVVVAGCYWLLGWVSSGRIPWRATGYALALGAAVTAASALLSPRVAERIDQLADLARGEVALNPIGHRLWIWRGTWNTFLAHPVNGVGARGLRHAFVDHAAPGDPYLAANPPTLPAHPHHMVLEVASETGIIGLAGLALAVLMLVRASLAAGPGGRAVLVPAGFALAAAAWPLNTHLALYSATWSQVLWWLVAVFAASLAVSGEDQRPAMRS